MCRAEEARERVNVSGESSEEELLEMWEREKLTERDTKKLWQLWQKTVAGKPPAGFRVM